MGSLRRRHWLFLVLGLAVVGALVAAVCAYRAAEPKEAAPPAHGRRAWLLAAAVSVLLLAGGLVGGAYAYDASRSSLIAPGVRVGHVDVEGLSAREARRKLAAAYRRLYRPIVVQAEAQRFVLDPGRVGLVVHVDEVVSRAVARSRKGWFLSRTLRDVADWDVGAQLSPRVTYSRVAVADFAGAVERTVERPPRAARVIPSATGIAVQPGRHGLEVNTARLRRELEQALAGGSAPREFHVPGRRLLPSLRLADLARRYPVYLTVDRAGFQLRLYERLKLVRTYPIAVGQIGYDTPSGLYRIQNKAINPTWVVPNSPWTGSLAGAVIPPGPSNPLKARWLGISGAVGIHGTDDTWSLGTAASHGCIRMAVPDVIQLYDRVPVGTPVYIG